MHILITRGARAAIAALVFGGVAFAAAAQTIVDYTEHTYAVRSRGTGTFANQTVTRAFDAPILSLKLFIVGGQADDIGYVGTQLVTSIPAPCSGVGAVTGEQEVTEQVTISGNTATFLLRAQENCCCWTGWGSATQGDRANARFRWEVTLGNQCEVPPLSPITDPDAISFEQGNRIDTEKLKPNMQQALDCLRTATLAGGGTFTLSSAYRPPAYQAHLREVWDRWDALENVRSPACAQRRTEVQAEFSGHTLKTTQRPAASSSHTRGEAFDATLRLPPGGDIDALANGCLLFRPLPITDDVHFIHR